MTRVPTLLSTLRRAASTLTKEAGDISSVFPSLSGKAPEPLPARFADLKRSLISGHEDAVAESWQRLLGSLRGEIDEIREKGSTVSVLFALDGDKEGRKNSSADRMSSGHTGDRVSRHCGWQGLSVELGRDTTPRHGGHSQCPAATASSRSQAAGEGVHCSQQGQGQGVPARGSCRLRAILDTFASTGASTPEHAEGPVIHGIVLALVRPSLRDLNHVSPFIC